VWSLLLVTLPTQPSAVRLRIWRALKAMGCGALRDGAYVLPQAQAGELEKVAADVQAHGGSASVLDLRTRTSAQEQELAALFDRGPAYADWHDGLTQLRGRLSALDETQARRRLRLAAEALLAIERTDYLPVRRAIKRARNWRRCSASSMQRPAPVSHAAATARSSCRPPRATAVGAGPRVRDPGSTASPAAG
jgi:hypothetical protein